MPVYNINYYIDAVNGDDDNNGTSEETPWKTFDNFGNTIFNAGNKILLRRGQSWLTTLAIGNGRDAVLDAVPGFTAESPVEDIMTAVLNNVIENLNYGTVEHPIEVGAYGSSGVNPKVSALRVNFTTGIKITNIDVTGEDYSDYYTTLIQHGHNVVIEDYYTKGLYTDYSTNVTIRRMISEYSREHGIYLCERSRSFTIEDSTMRYNTAHGIQTNGGQMDNNLIQGCGFYGNRSAHNDVRSFNTVFYRNYFVTGETGKCLEIQMSGSGNKYYNNVFVSTYINNATVGLSNPDDVTFKNNIFFAAEDAIVGGSSSQDCDYNCFYAYNLAGNQPIMNWSWTFANWKSSTGNDAHSLVTDPKFVSFNLAADPATWDLRLQASSPLINKGMNVGYDFSGSAPDIGIFESN